jgi:MarR-like DNA-binding transcriptional regulator SgrR of sgrS sRNA
LLLTPFQLQGSFPIIQVIDFTSDVKSSDVANLLGISTRQARELLSKWSGQGWLEIADPSRRGRKYSLADKYQDLI